MQTALLVIPYQVEHIHLMVSCIAPLPDFSLAHLHNEMESHFLRENLYCPPSYSHGQILLLHQIYDQLWINSFF